MWQPRFVIKFFQLVVFALSVGLAIGLVTRSFWHDGIPYTHDGENHLARFANYKLALKEGQFPPRWAPTLMNRYGYPVFNYNYPLPNMVAMPVVVMGASYQLTYKLIILGSLASAALGTIWALRQHGFSWGARGVAVMSMITSPYLVSAILFRGSIGEVVLIGLTPWLLGLIELIAQKGWTGARWLCLVAVGSSWLLAHNVGVLILVPVLVVWAIIRWPSQWRWWWPAVFASGAMGGLVSWFWLPALVEKSSVVLDAAGLSTQAGRHAVTVGQWLWSPLKFGFSYPGPIDSLSFQVGFLSWLSWLVVVVGGAVAQIRGRRSWPVVISLSLGLGAVVLGLQAWPSFWSMPGLVRFVQFPWRLTLGWLVVSSWWIAWAWDRSRGWLTWGLFGALVVQLVVVSRLQPVDFRYYDDAYYEAFGQSTSTANENRPKDFEYQNIGDWQPQPLIATGSATVQVLSWTGSRHVYQLRADSAVEVIEPTAWFPGWQTSVTVPAGETFSVKHQPPSDLAGRIGFQLPRGEYEVTTVFTQRTWPRIVGNSLTLITGLLVAMGWLVITWRQGRKKGR